MLTDLIINAGVATALRGFFKPAVKKVYTVMYNDIQCTVFTCGVLKYEKSLT
jgi:hypothetical protein